MKVNHQIVVRTALKLLNEVGLEQLTLRKLASKLEIQAPTLYWHFKSKEDLIDAMATLVLAESAVEMFPARKSSNWQNWIKAFGLGLRKSLLKYRDGARMVAGSKLTDTKFMETVEILGARMIKAGFSLRKAVVLMNGVYIFTVSFVVEEQAVFPTPGQRSPKYDLKKRKQKLEKFPFLRASGGVLFDQFERRYKETLQLMIDGASSPSLQASRPNSRTRLMD